MDDFETSYWHSLDRQAAQNLSVPPSQLGISTPPMKSQLEGLKSKIFQGAQAVELGFWGRGKGSLQAGSTVPGMFGKDEREAMKDLAKINNINLSTHASVAVQGLAGLNQEGKFSDEFRQDSVNEVKQTIDFAAEVAKGGPIVIHTGEFNRPPSEIKGGMFEAYRDQFKKAPVQIVDDRTGQVMVLRRDQNVWVPKLDAEGHIVIDPRTGQPTPEKLTIDAIEREAEAQKKAPSVLFVEKLEERKKLEAQAEAERWSALAHSAEMRVRAIEKQLQEVENLPREQQTPEVLGPLKLQKEEHKREKEYYSKGAAAYTVALEELKEQMGHIKPINDFALDKTKQSIADAAMYALEQTKAQKCDKPLFVAPENIFPENYGGHPEELKKIVEVSREEMAKRLMTDGKSKEEAEELAKKHIKATFDIGHAYTWKKYFKPTKDVPDFNTWLLNQVGELTEKGIIGHVHITDNFGYSDEHLTPGEGTVPIKEFLAKMKEAGHKEPVIVEPAHQDWQAMTGAWKHLNSPAYRIDATSHTWTDVAGGYFGQTRSPNYLFGETAPDQKTWTLWSEVPLE